MCDSSMPLSVWSFKPPLIPGSLEQNGSSSIWNPRHHASFLCKAFPNEHSRCSGVCPPYCKPSPSQTLYGVPVIVKLPLVPVGKMGFASFVPVDSFGSHSGCFSAVGVIEVGCCPYQFSPL